MVESRTVGVGRNPGARVRSSTLLVRDLLWYRWPHLCTVLAVGVCSAVLTGALIVGDSMRGSLREFALGGLGRIDHALVCPRFFREALAGGDAGDTPKTSSAELLAPIILTRGALERADGSARVGRAEVLGVDERFWRLRATPDSARSTPPSASTVPSTTRRITLNEPLAKALSVRLGDDLLLRIPRADAIWGELLFGRRDRNVVSIRLTVDRIIPAEDLGRFALRPSSAPPLNAYVPLAVLQRALKRPGRCNAMLSAGSGSDSAKPSKPLQQRLRDRLTLDDIGLRLRRDAERGYLAIESESILIDPAIERACTGAPAPPLAGVLTYLADSLSLDPPPSSPPAPSIPYATVAAIDASDSARMPLRLVDGSVVPKLAEDEILLNEWAAQDLGTAPGRTIRMTYRVVSSFGEIRSQTREFRVRGIVKLDEAAADRGWAPEYEGVTNAQSMSDWDPPFPIDMKQIRPKDEDYWKRYGPAPKAFIALGMGQLLWTQSHERFGRLTSLRRVLAAGTDVADAAARFERDLLSRMPPDRFGLTFEPIRKQAIEAARGNTDFSGLFVGFSFFLIAAAALLVALLFRLSVEQRGRQIGILLAVGLTPRRVAWHLFVEGAILAILGAAIGLLGAGGYASLMLAGLQTWWSAAATPPILRTHFSPTTFLIGAGASAFVGLASIAWALRGMTRLTPTALLTGATPDTTGEASTRSAKVRRAILILSIVAAIALFVVAVRVPVPAFFGIGVSVLIAALTGLADLMHQVSRSPNRRSPLASLTRLALRNIGRNPRRSLTTVALIACACFILIVTAVHRRRPDADGGRQSGTGGFTFVAESTVPILHNLSFDEGRKALNLPPLSSRASKETAIYPFRLRAGDDASCLNLYPPNRPRILGAPEAMIQRGGFLFASSQAQTRQQQTNPWLLLNHVYVDGAIPTIGDESTVRWLLHLGLGQDLSITDDLGQTVRLRIIAMLSGSALQGEMIIAESRFLQLFPSVVGRSFFLIEARGDGAAELRKTLESALSDYGMILVPATERLGRYMAVENTYLSVFATLGGLGMVLGTLALAAVLVRGVFERRTELAVLQALGFGRRALKWIVLSEHAALLLLGIAVGGSSAILAAAPHLRAQPESVPWLSLALTLGAMGVVGIGSAWAAMTLSLRSPLLPALHRN